MKALRLIGFLIQENGLAWTACCLMYSAFLYAFHLDLHVLERVMSWLETRYTLPGMSSRKINRFIWQNWNWESHGDEWTDSKEWKDALVNDVLFKYIEPGKTILEIGPGGGRWTEHLQKLAQRLIVADLSEHCLNVCRSRFAHCANIEYLLTDGASLPGIDEDSVDYVWSFDVFVHVTPEDIESYLPVIIRVLKPGGLALIHHAKEGGVHGAWRSRMTQELFAELVRKAGGSVVVQLDRIGETAIPLSPHRDTITVFRK